MTNYEDIKRYLRLMNLDRSQTIIASLVLGFALGSRTGFAANLAPAIALSVALLLIYGGGAVLNNISDAKFDGKNNPISSGFIGKRSAFLFSIFLNLAGLSMTYPHGRFAVVVGLLLALSGAVYSYFIRVKDRVWCTLFLGLTHHVLPITLGYYVAKHALDVLYVIFSAAIYVFIVGVILVKDFKDLKRDMAEGRKNIAILLGLEKTALVVFSFSVAYTLMTVFLLWYAGVNEAPLLSAMVLATAGGIVTMGAMLAKTPTQELGDRLLPNYRKFVSANFMFWAVALALT